MMDFNLLLLLLLSNTRSKPKPKPHAAENGASSSRQRTAKKIGQVARSRARHIKVYRYSKEKQQNWDVKIIM